jgi:thiamine phosphate synthase YjbQ (UPF0047 family)
MTAYRGLLRLQTEGHGQISDLTDGVRSVVSRSGTDLGMVTVFAIGSTVAVTTMEYEPGAVVDLQGLLDRLIPGGLKIDTERDRDSGTPGSAFDYAHNRLNGDTNAHAHLRAALIGPSVTIPLIGGELTLGTWQQIVLLDFDDRPRSRSVAVHVTA